MEHPTNREIALALHELADLSRHVGAFHPARAYRAAATSIARLPVSVGALAMAGTASQLRGIGRSIEGRIVELCETGTIERLEELRREAPPMLLLLGRIPGVGTKTANAIWDALRPRSPDDLLEMADDGRLASVRGVGPVTVDAVRMVLHQMEDSPDAVAESILRTHARRTLDDVATILRSTDEGIVRIVEAGQLARGCELIDAIELVVVARDAAETTARVRALLDRRGWRAADEIESESAHVTFALDALSGVALRIHVTDEAHEALATMRAIGPPMHAAAVTASLENAPAAGADEAALYRRARLAWIPPEQRDRPDAFVRAREAYTHGEAWPTLVEVGDLRGELHCHSTWSDGRATIEAMAQAAISRGYDHIAITDHSWSLRIANGLSPGQLAAQSREIAAIRSSLPGDFALLHGTEMEILPDGSLDFDDHLLGRLDWVVAAIHVRQRQERDEITARIERAMRNPFVDCIAHPTSRLLLRRPKTQLDVDRLIELAAQTGTALEINSAPDRLDLDAASARRAADAGVRLCINSDAHGTNTLGLVEHGIAVARRAGLEPDDVLNARSWTAVRELQKRWRAG